MMLGQKMLAFIRKDFRSESSYKVAFIFEIMQSLMPLFSFYFIGQMLVGKSIQSLSRYGGNYFSFVLIGVALTQYFMMALNSFATTIRRAQWAGCLEAMLSTQTSPTMVVLLSPLYSFLFKLMHVLIIIFVGAVFLGVDISQMNITSALVMLAASILAFSSVGILSAAIIVLIKKGDPIEYFIGAILALISGAFFPLEILPHWAQQIAKFSPLTHALEGMRMAIFRGANLAELSKPLALLGVMTFILLPLSTWLFAMAVEQGRRDGNLMHY